MYGLGTVQYQDWVGGLRVIGTFSPTIAGFLLTYMEERSLGAFDLWRRGWYCEKFLYLVIAIVLIPVLCLFSLWLAIMTEGVVPAEIINISRIDVTIPYIITVFFIGGPLQEEFGWRGYALDRLESKYNALSSSIIVGVLWSLWHLPSFFIPGTIHNKQPFYAFFTSVLLISILFTWLYNNSERSILVVLLFHTSINVSYWIIPINSTFTGPIYYTIMLGIVVILVIIFYGSNELIRKKRPKIKKIKEENSKIQ
jgi:membrane protease YdiL (CAAX protease family)